jgi:glucose-6-phosphate isomerase
MSLVIDYKNVLGFINESDIEALSESACTANKLLHSKKGLGRDFLGWVSLPEDVLEETSRIKKVASEIRENAEVLVVIGIGGSYLGARAVIESFSQAFEVPKKGSPQVIYAGHNMSGAYHKELIEYLNDKDFYINVISKSGTTTEPAIAFRLLKEYAESRYGETTNNRIIATTDKKQGALNTLAKENNYRTFIIPDNVGGRFSLFSAVGLLPIACAGIDIIALLNGALQMAKETESEFYDKNPAMLYAIIRNALYNKGFTNEIMVNYIPRMSYISEWWKQLYGESEGKENKGIFPASVNFSTDLHSLGQYIQDGHRNIFETVINVDKENKDIVMKVSSSDLDGLNYLSGMNMHDINKSALKATVLAHVDGGTPNIIIDVDKICESTIGEMIYFFEKACGISGYMLGVNPFDQPGVEAYKNNMFAILGKKGYEKLSKELESRL